MDLNARLSADYVELVNNYLDSIPVHNNEDFEAIKSCLQNFLNDEQAKIPCSEDLKERITLLKELYDHPEMYATPENSPLLQEIILSRIAAKVDEIQAFIPEQKQEKINEQQEHNQQPIERHNRRAQAEVPEESSEDHTMTDQQFYEEIREGRDVGSDLSDTPLYSIEDDESILSWDDTPMDEPDGIEEGLEGRYVAGNLNNAPIYFIDDDKSILPWDDAPMDEPDDI